MKIREAAKSIVLVLLILSTIVMTVRLWNVDDRLNTSFGVFQSLGGLMDRIGLSGLLENLRGDAETDDDVTYSDRLISPARLLIREEGRLFDLDFGGGQRMAQSLTTVYPLLDGCLASGSSRLTGESAKQEWKQALLSDGMLLDLGRPVPYLLFAGQTEDPDELLSKVSLRHLVLTSRPEGIRCLIKDTVTGNVFLFEDSQSPDVIGTVLQLLREEATALPVTLAADGFSQGSYPDGLFLGLTLSPEILVLPDASVSALEATNPVYQKDGTFNIQQVYELLGIFEYNPKAKSYSDAGAVTYVENFSSIRIETDGWLRYKANQAAGGISVASLIGTQKESYSGYEMVMAAIHFISQFDSQVTGGSDADLRFSGVSYDEQSKTVAVDFAYTSGGIRIDLAEGYAARVTFEAGYLRYADILLRGYGASDTVVEEIGFLKALELLKTSSGRSSLSLDTFELCYEDNGGNALIRPQYEGRTLGGGGG